MLLLCVWFWFWGFRVETNAAALSASSIQRLTLKSTVKSFVHPPGTAPWNHVGVSAALFRSINVSVTHECVDWNPLVHKADRWHIEPRRLNVLMTTFALPRVFCLFATVIQYCHWCSVVIKIFFFFPTVELQFQLHFKKIFNFFHSFKLFCIILCSIFPENL